MEDYREGAEGGINSRIRSLQGKLKNSRDALSRKKFIDNISKLEQQRLHSDNLFVEQEDQDEEELPILSSIRSRYQQLSDKYRDQVREIRDLLIYMHYFEDEYLGLFHERKLRLDVKFSVERDGFYNQFNQLHRRALAYCDESNRIQGGNYTKSYEDDILRRMVEMRHGVYIEADRFFRQVQRFSADLLKDIRGEQILCQNADDPLEYSPLDREKELRDLTVGEGIARLNEISREIVDFLDVPDFQSGLR